MNVNFKFEPGDEVVEKATGLRGRVVVCGIDEISTTYEVSFEQRILGRRRHWKRPAEIKAAPKKKAGPKQKA